MRIVYIYSILIGALFITAIFPLRLQAQTPQANSGLPSIGDPNAQFPTSSNAPSQNSNFGVDKNNLSGPSGTNSLNTGGTSPLQGISTNPKNSTVGDLSGNAGSETGLVKCGTSRDCTICDIFILIRDIFNFALGLLASLAVLSIVIGGVYILTSAGNPGGVSTGYGIITNAVIGLLLVMASFLLFSFLLVGLGFQEQNFSAVLTFQPGKVFEVKCDTASTFNDNGSNGGGAATTGGGSGNVGISGIACLDATNIDDETSAVMRAISYYEAKGGARAGYFTANGGTVLPESTKNHPGSVGGGSGAYGRYQVMPNTWPEWASAAGVPKSGSAWDISPQYQDAAVAGYLKRTNINTCDSFATNAKKPRNEGNKYTEACKWTSMPGCTAANQQNNNSAARSDFAAFCKRLLEDEKTGACKQ